MLNNNVKISKWLETNWEEGIQAIQYVCEQTNNQMNNNSTN